MRLAIVGLLMLSSVFVLGCEPGAAQSVTATATNAVVPTATVAPSAAPSAAPSSTPAPTPTQTSTPVPSPTPGPSLTRITDGKCCTQPFWSPDSKQVLFIDKPNAGAPTGIYAVDVDTPAAPRLLTERVAFYTADMQYAQTTEGEFAVVTRLADGKQFRIGTGGRTVLLSPDRTRVVWSEAPQSGPFENRTTVIKSANLDGSAARPIVSLLRAGVIAWLDNTHLLLTARLDRNSQAISLLMYSLADGAQQVLVSSEHLRSIALSPSGEWIAYTIVVDKSAEQNGLWLMHRDGSAKKRLDFFGAFQWRDGQHLVFVPLDLSQPEHSFSEYDAVSGTTRSLTGGAEPFRIANGDWSVSPDGHRIVFLSADDLNLWVWSLGS